MGVHEQYRYNKHQQTPTLNLQNILSTSELLRATTRKQYKQCRMNSSIGHTLLNSMNDAKAKLKVAGLPLFVPTVCQTALHLSIRKAAHETRTIHKTKPVWRKMDLATSKLLTGDHGSEDETRRDQQEYRTGAAQDETQQTDEESCKCQQARDNREWNI